MIKKRTIMLLLVSLFMGVGAAWVANNWVGSQLVPEATADANMANIVVASLAIPFGTKIEVNHIKLVEIPKTAIPAGAFTSTEEVVGMIAKQAIFSGELLIPEKLADHEGGSTLAAVIQPKMRAITLRVNDVIGVAGFLLPGNHVDILATKQVGRKKAQTETVLKNIKVLAVDQTASTDKNEPVIVRAVTLEMTPEQTETLVTAQQEGPIQLTLRNPNEELVVEVPEPEPEPVVMAKRPVRRAAPVSRVTIIKGTRVHTEKPKN